MARDIAPTGVMPLFSRTEVWREVEDEVTGGTRNIPVADRWTILWPILPIRPRRIGQEVPDGKVNGLSAVRVPEVGGHNQCISPVPAQLALVQLHTFRTERYGRLSTPSGQFFRYGKGDGFTHYRFWPLFDYFHKENTFGGSSTVMNVLWPFFWYYEDVFPEYTEQRIQIFPFFLLAVPRISTRA